MSAGIHQSMRRGAAWMLLFKLAERSLGLISTLVLVRVLAPEDFGVVAMAMSFIAAAELLTAVGFDLALVQNQQASAEHSHTAWTGNLMLGLLITAVMIASAQPIATFYGRPEVFWVVCALALGPTIGGAENIGVVAFRKELDFKKEFRFLLSKKLIGVMVVIPLALWLRSYWALVIGTLVSRAAGTAISYLVHPFRPHLSLRHMGELMRFSRWMLVNNVIVLFKEKSIDLVIGSMQGPRALGLFNVSNEFAQLPHTELAAPVNRALLPAFAKIQGDREAVHQAFVGALQVLVFAVVPAAALLHAVAPFLVPVLLGSKWLEAVPLMQILPLAGGFIAVHSLMCSLLVAHGRPDAVAWSHVFYVTLLFGALLVLVPRIGVTGAAFAVLIAAVGSTPAYMFQIRKRVGVRARAILPAVSRPLLAAGAMLVVLYFLLPAPGPATGFASNFLYLALGCVVGALTYLGTALALWWLAGRPAGAEQALVSRVQALLAQRRGAVAP